MFVERLKKLNLKDWKLTETKEDRIIFEKKGSPYSIPTFKIIIDDSLGFSISAFGWLLPETHDLHTDNYRSIRNITLSSLLQDFNSLTMYKGLQNGQHSTSKRHVVRKEVDPLGVDSTDEESEITLEQSDSLEFFRSRHCELLIGKDCEKCQQCAHLQVNTNKLASRAKAKKATPAKFKAPISQIICTPSYLDFGLGLNMYSVTCFDFRVVQLKLLKL